MINVIINGFMSAIQAFFSLFTAPISALFSLLFGGLDVTLADTITRALNSIYEVIDEIVYPATILPHSFLSCLDICLALMLSYLTIAISYYMITWFIRTIQHINPFSSGGGKV